VEKRGGRQKDTSEKKVKFRCIRAKAKEKKEKGITSSLNEGKERKAWDRGPRTLKGENLHRPKIFYKPQKQERSKETQRAVDGERENGGGKVQFAK